MDTVHTVVGQDLVLYEILWVGAWLLLAESQINSLIWYIYLAISAKKIFFGLTNNSAKSWSYFRRRERR